MSDSKTTKRWIENGIIGCLMVIAIIGVLLTLGPDLQRVFEIVKGSLS